MKTTNGEPMYLVKFHLDWDGPRDSWDIMTKKELNWLLICQAAYILHTEADGGNTFEVGIGDECAELSKEKFISLLSWEELTSEEAETLQSVINKMGNCRYDWYLESLCTMLYENMERH